MAAARAALHGQPLTLDGHRLINLRHEFSEARRTPDGDTYQGIARFRAVTEPVRGQTRPAEGRHKQRV